MSHRTPTCLLLAFAMSAQACYRSAPLGPEGPVPQRRVRVSSATPFALRTTDLKAGEEPCLVERVDASVRRVAGDTIHFATVFGYDRAPGVGGCRRPGDVFVVLSEVQAPQVDARKYSALRSVALVVLGIPAALIAAIVIACGGTCQMT